MLVRQVQRWVEMCGYIKQRKIASFLFMILSNDLAYVYGFIRSLKLQRVQHVASSLEALSVTLDIGQRCVELAQNMQAFSKVTYEYFRIIYNKFVREVVSKGSFCSLPGTRHVHSCCES